MRELTFKGFLKQYVYSLSSAKTHGLYKLAKEATLTNYRLQEPLFLYALFIGKEEVLLKFTKDPDLHHEYSDLLKKYNKDNMEEALQKNNSDLPQRYLRVYVSYTSLMMRKENKKHIKKLQYEQIRRLQKEKGISNYRLYTDLKLHASNVNSFLKTGNVRKVSQETADKMLSYLGWV